jgi:hypothetical protein
MLFFCAILTALGLLLNYVSAPTYGTIFLSIAICDLIVIFCLLRFNRVGKVRQYASVFLGLVAVYTLVDITLRAVAGVRTFDLL